MLQSETPVNNATIEILDLTGRNVYKKVYATLSKEELDLSALADGVYYARVSDGEKVYATEKIIKQQ